MRAVGRSAKLIALLTCAGVKPVVAQQLSDTIHTSRGTCHVWAAPPGFSNPTDFAYNRCALSRVPVLRPDSPMPPAPVYGLSASLSVYVVVKSDGTVDSNLTRPWSESDGRFTERALESIRRWRFEPGQRAGKPVRSGFTIHIESGTRNDTLASEMRWDYRARPTVSDSLLGTWVPLSPPVPYSAVEQDSVYASVIKNLRDQQVILPRRDRHYCIILTDQPIDTSREVALLRATVGTFGFTPARCDRTPGFLRVFLSRISRTENSRAVVFVHGDYLPFYPPGLDARSYAAWAGRCVVVTDDGTSRASCGIRPEAADAEVMADFRQLERRRGVGSTLDSAFAAVYVTTTGAAGVDTLPERRVVLRSLSNVAVLDTPGPCGYWQLNMADSGRKIFVIHGDLKSGMPDVTDAITAPLVIEPGGQLDCGGRERMKEFFAFIPGEVSDVPSSPITLCYSGCARSYTLDPAKNLVPPNISFGIADLRPITRSGTMLRVRVDGARLPPTTVAVFVVWQSGSRPLATIANRIPGDFWDFTVNYTDAERPDTRFLIYLFSR